MAIEDSLSVCSEEVANLEDQIGLYQSIANVEKAKSTELSIVNKELESENLGLAKDNAKLARKVKRNRFIGLVGVGAAVIGWLVILL